MKKNKAIMNGHAGVGAGKFRQPFRIREFLSGEGLTMIHIARELGMHHSVVTYTVKGIKNNIRVLNYLQNLGCPKEFLSMPEVKQYQNN